MDRRLWNQFQTRGTVTRMTGEGHYRESTSAQDCYTTLSSRRHRRTTATYVKETLSCVEAQLVRDFSAVSRRNINTQPIYSCLSETVLHAHRLVWSSL
ncbi:hypothetical protein TNCV_4840321 [Trichonephila clavipes]|nr:hypothetical protein TNCV_4840321 [Trichonephila clavipes]